MTLQCELDANSSAAPIVSFEIQSPFSTICTLDANHGECRNTSDPHVNIFNASCPSTTRCNIQVIVPLNWNNVAVLCQSLYKKSNNVVFFVDGMIFDQMYISICLQCTRTMKICKHYAVTNNFFLLTQLLCKFSHISLDNIFFLGNVTIWVVGLVLDWLVVRSLCNEQKMTSTVVHSNWHRLMVKKNSVGFSMTLLYSATKWSTIPII